YLMDPASIATGPSRELLDGSERQGVDTEARGMFTGQFPENRAQRVGRGELVVAIGDDQQAARALNAPAEKPHEIERRFVGPVQVPPHPDAEGVRRREPLDQAGEELLARQARRARGPGRGGHIPMVCTKGVQHRSHETPPCHAIWSRETFLTDCRFLRTRREPRPGWRWARATSPTRSPGFTRT